MKSTPWFIQPVRLLTLGALSIGLLELAQPQAATAQVCNTFGCSPAGAGQCNPFGCPKAGAGQCNPFGCPNPGAGDCTPFGCPASPPGYGAEKPQASPTVILVPEQRNNSGGIGECMDRVMYRQLQATSGPNQSGQYEFSQPKGATNDAMQAAGMKTSYWGGGTTWYGRQAIARVQMMDAPQAAQICR